ncbi:MAG TPA: nicotinamide-nucleotide amidohydrolase family protein [Deltaproteobacteria bacterium]|nr:nicotinamide-nucleotide amidohydrolase family protein [Deltaproteobacteria bacterium]
MRLCVAVTGTEILTGRRSDALLAPIAAMACARGWTMVEARFVPDDAGRVAHTVGALMEGADMVIVTGGLGLTPDDTTHEAVSILLKAHPEAVRSQIPNPVGSAPGVDIRFDGCRVVFLPGVPQEALAMVPLAIGGRDASGDVLVEIPVFGMRETAIAQALGPLAQECSFLPAEMEVRLVVPGRIEPEVRSILGNNALAPDGLAADLGSLLASRGLTMAAAESCTGGLVGHLVTQVPGSSAYFLGSVVSYADEVKASTLGVARETLESFGAVSGETAREMLSGVLRLTGADVGVATTGIAGPEGGSPDKPVGTVWICAGTRGFADAVRYEFPFNRAGNKMAAAKTALFMLRNLVHDQGVRGPRPAV